MKIKLNNTTNIDLNKLIESRLLIQANSGGGKSWAIRRLIEQAFGKVQIIVLDPEGEFGNMRSKFDFVYAGKGGDAPVESRSAALLARRLLELKASAIIDLYELPPQERKHFVRLFCEAMVNAPKELWHDCLVIIDEAHVFAPEKSDSEALGPVIDLATRGRKRGYCVVLASQRISKLHKDAAAECNNKLIGRTALDIDRKRAGEELGITSKEEVLALRNLMPGEFMAFGPAIGNDVKKLYIGDVGVKPPSRGVTRSVAAPSATVKKILSKLADLPQEAAEEARTTKELKVALDTAQRRVRELERAPKTVTIPGPIMKGLTEKEVDARLRSALHRRDLEWEKVVKNWERFAVKIHVALRDAATMANNLVVPLKLPPFTLTPSNLKEATVTLKNQHPQKGERLSFQHRLPPMRNLGKPLPVEIKRPGHVVDLEEEVKLGSGELRLLKILAQRSPMRMTRAQLGLLAKVKSTTGTFRNYISKLKMGGMIEVEGDFIKASELGIESSGEESKAPQTLEELIAMWRESLPAGVVRIFDLVVEASPEPISRADIAERLNIAATTGTFRNYISILKTNGLIETQGDMLELSTDLLGF